MSKFFNFWDPLERRYVFNSFLVVVALVEILIFGVTVVWQVAGNLLEGPEKATPFPWMAYLFVAFAAPLAMLFIFGVIVRGFQALGPEAEEGTGQPDPGKPGRPHLRFQFFLGLAAFLGLLSLWFYGRQMLGLAALFIKGLGLGGAYLLVAVVALAALYLPLRLILKYRLQKKALEYQYLVYLAEHHGVVLRDPRELAAYTPGELEDKPSRAQDHLLLPPPGAGRQDG
jgi:hypothetical protein